MQTTTLKLMFVVVAVLSTTGCYSVKATAPRGTTVTLADEAPATGQGKTKRTWYMMNGLLALNDNSTNELIDPDCAKAGISHEMTVVDGMIGAGMSIGATVAGLIVGGLAGNPGAGLLVGMAAPFFVVPSTRTTTAYCYEHKAVAQPFTPVPMPPGSQSSAASTSSPGAQGASQPGPAGYQLPPGYVVAPQGYQPPPGYVLQPASASR